MANTLFPHKISVRRKHLIGKLACLVVAEQNGYLEWHFGVSRTTTRPGHIKTVLYGVYAVGSRIVYDVIAAVRTGRFEKVR